METDAEMEAVKTVTALPAVPDPGSNGGETQGEEEVEAVTDLPAEPLSEPTLLDADAQEALSEPAAEEKKDESPKKKGLFSRIFGKK